MFRGWITADYLQASQLVIGVLEIIVTAFVAVWIVRSVQRKQENDRVLKDHLAHELINLRADVRTFLEKLMNGTIKAQHIKREHHLLSIRMRDILGALNKKYGVDKQKLKAYRSPLLKIVEEDEDYQQKCQGDELVSLSKETTLKLHEIRINNDHVFNDILLKIYE